MEKFEETIFRGFNGRTESLKQIKRFSIRPNMFYRTDLYLHSLRVSWLVEEVSPFAKKAWSNFNQDLAKTLALVHDDAEIVTGDVQLGHKMRMEKAELAKVDEKEKEAIKILSKKFPKSVNGFSYKKLLTLALRKSSIEAQVVAFADKLDAYGESLHELFAGNIDFILPSRLYSEILSNFQHKFNKFPRVRKIMTSEHLLLTLPKKADFMQLVQKGKPHIKQSVVQKTGFPHYDFWKRITLERLGKQGLSVLTKQKEFYELYGSWK